VRRWIKSGKKGTRLRNEGARDERGEARSPDCLRRFGGGVARAWDEPDGGDIACPFDSLRRLYASLPPFRQRANAPDTSPAAHVTPTVPKT
jgi:hypothetical protein